jgi:sec-independent protein translocase protein TatA
MVGDIMQPTHLLFVLVIALLVLGPKRLPEVGRQLGKGLRDFRAAINGERPDHEEELDAAQHQHGTESELYQPPPQPVEHQFAHDTTEPAPDQHQFAHASSEPGGNGHQSAPENPAQAPGVDADAGAGRPAGEHEFAYEPARPAEKPVDPLP